MIGDNYHYLEGPQAIDTLVNQGVLHEVNRTFFHPIGLSLVMRVNANDSTELKIKIVDASDEFVIQNLDKFKQRVFSNLLTERMTKRQDSLGFVIQTRNFFEESAEREIPFETKKLEAIIEAIDSFAFKMRERVFRKHVEKDTERSGIPEKEDMASRMLENILNGNLIDCAVHAAMIRFYDEIQEKIEAALNTSGGNQNADRAKKN